MKKIDFEALQKLVVFTVSYNYKIIRPNYDKFITWNMNRIDVKTDDSLGWFNGILKNPITLYWLRIFVLFYYVKINSIAYSNFVKGKSSDPIWFKADATYISANNSLFNKHSYTLAVSSSVINQRGISKEELFKEEYEQLKYIVTIYRLINVLNWNSAIINKLVEKS